MKNILPLLVAVLVVGGIVYFAIRSNKDDYVGNQPPSTEETQRKNGDAWAKGNLESKVVLTEYSDFQCPACKGWEEIIKPIFNKYKADIKLEYRQFPLTSIHKNAYSAARAAEAAGLQGKFWEMHDLLFKNQEAWSKSLGVETTFKNYAKSLSLDEKKFIHDYRGSVTKDNVDSDMQKGDSLGINGTPSLYLNNEAIKPESEEQFESLIAEAIDSKKRESDNKQ